MSLRSDWEDCKESFKEALPKPILKGIFKISLLVHSGGIAELASESWLKRQALPEPFDVAAHIGNAREAALVTMASILMLGAPALIEKPREIAMRNAKRVAMGSFAISSSVQVTAEHFGITNSLVEANTPDMLDAAYGVGWSGLVAVGSLRLFRSTEQALHDRALAVSAEDGTAPAE